METVGSMSHSQGLTDNPYPAPNQQNSSYWYLFLYDPFYICQPRCTWNNLLDSRPNVRGFWPPSWGWRWIFPGHKPPDAVQERSKSYFKKMKILEIGAAKWWSEKENTLSLSKMLGYAVLQLTITSKSKLHYQTHSPLKSGLLKLCAMQVAWCEARNVLKKQI